MGNPLPWLRDTPRPLASVTDLSLGPLDSVADWSPSESLSAGYLSVEGVRHANAIGALWTARSQHARDYAAALLCFPVGHTARSLQHLGHNVGTFFTAQESVETSRHILSLSTIELLRPERWAPTESLFIRIRDAENRRHSDVISGLISEMLQLLGDYRETVSRVPSGTSTLPLQLLRIDMSNFNTALTGLEFDHHNNMLAITDLLFAFERRG